METFNLGHGAIESNITVTDVHVDNVQAGGPTQSFSIDYTGIVHDNQRGIGICTAADVADAMHKIFGFPVSEQFIYVLGKRLIDGNTSEGSSIKTMLQIAYKYGAPRKELVPTDDTHKSYQDYISIDFSPEVYADALKQRIAGYARVNTDMQSIIDAGSQSQTGIQLMLRVGNNFYTANGVSTWDKTKLSPLAVPNPITGAHSIKTIKGGQDKNFTLRNSWGDALNPVYQPNGVWSDGDIDFKWDTQAPYIVEAWTILPQPVNVLFKHFFSKPINFGETSTEVTALQRVLTILGAYSGPVTGWYGPLTMAAVKGFQMAHGITSGDGRNVGPATRGQLNLSQGL